MATNLRHIWRTRSPDGSVTLKLIDPDNPASPYFEKTEIVHVRKIPIHEKIEHNLPQDASLTWTTDDMGLTGDFYSKNYDGPSPTEDAVLLKTVVKATIIKYFSAGSRIKIEVRSNGLRVTSGDETPGRVKMGVVSNGHEVQIKRVRVME